MANYVNLRAAIDAGINNMTVLRNNSANDDSTTAYAVDASWFKFNGVAVSNIYSNGNSWLGFGANGEQLKVNRRDCKVWYEYVETGNIGRYKFLKFRWCGYSYYNSTSDSYKQQWDVYLIEGGIIFLDFFMVPTTTGSGINSLTADSTVTFTVTEGTPCQWTFTPSDPENGKSYTVAEGQPNLISNYKPSGSALYVIDGITGNAQTSTISWDNETPEGTSVAVSVSTDGQNFTPVTNGGQFVPPGSYENATVQIRVDLATNDISQTPLFSNLHISMSMAEDQCFIVLEFASGNQSSVQNAVGPITVAYNGTTLAGLGGFVQAFELECSIGSMDYKGGQNDVEHIEFSSITATGTLTKIEYQDAKSGDEHIEFSSITATGTLTHVDDI